MSTRNPFVPRAGQLGPQAPLMQQEFDVDLAQSWMVGDQDSDLLCGRAAGCKVALIEGSVVHDCADALTADDLDVVLPCQARPVGRVVLEDHPVAQDVERQPDRGRKFCCAS